MIASSAFVVAALASAPLLMARALRGHGQVVRVSLWPEPRKQQARGSARVFDEVGKRVRRAVGHPHHDVHDRAIGRVVVFVPVCAIVEPLLVAPVLMALISWPVVQERRLSRLRKRQLVRELPEIVDLYSVALHSGHNIATASHEVARRGDGLFASSLTEAIERVDRGRPLDRALESLVDELGSDIRPVTGLLVSGLRYGVPIADSLARVASDLRLERRRHAEQAARRLPVVMLFPLVLCVLPAFGLLTVVPVLVESLQSLSLP